MEDNKRKRSSSPDATKDYDILVKFTNEELILELNSRMAKNQWFVCDSCNRIKTYEADYMDTSKHGYARPFCLNCQEHCKSCDESYVSSMSYQHDDCSRSSSDNEENEDEEEEEEVVKEETSN